MYHGQPHFQRDAHRQRERIRRVSQSSLGLHSLAIGRKHIPASQASDKIRFNLPWQLELTAPGFRNAAPPDGPRSPAPTVPAQKLRTLRAEVDALRGHIALISDISRRITASLDLHQVLQEVVDAACELTQARYGALAVVDESGRIQEFFTCGITPEIHQLIGDLPEKSGVLGLLSEL